MNKTTFHIPKMDCGAEEQLIRMKLDDEASISKLKFDLPGRKLEVYHQESAATIARKIEELGLGSQLVNTTAEYFSDEIEPTEDTGAEKRLLWIVFFINFGFFILEIITGFIARSMGLVADSLDMLADAIIFAMSLLVVGKALSSKKKIARLAGYLQLVLALYGIFEVAKRFYGQNENPDFKLMIIISAIALVGNALTLYLLQKAKSKEVHIRASSIFITNDVMINAGVILAGAVVYFMHSKIPDLIVGGVVFLLVGRGALQILKISK